MLLVFFFFKQKTAYEMRISDWSSDVCSSDLDQPSLPRRGTLVGLIGSAFYGGNLLRPPRAILERADEAALHHVGDSAEHVLTVAPDLLSQVRLGDGLAMLDRSEERRVGKECVSTCRSRWSPAHYKQKNTSINSNKYRTGTTT